MSFPRYPTYKNSGVEWLGDVPGHWQTKKLRYASECLDGGRIPLNAAQRADKQGEIPYWGANSIVDYVDESLFDEDLVLLGEDGAPFFDRSKPVAFFSQGKVWPNNHVHVLRSTVPDGGRFIVHALNITDYAQFIDGSTRDKLTQGSMNSIPLPWPPATERASVVAFLDRETAKIDALVREQQRLCDLLREKVFSLALSSAHELEGRTMRLRDAATIVSRPVVQRVGELYTPVGLFNWGRGLFHKDARDIDEMGDSEFFWIEDGDFIISGQFAWEGAVALAGPSDAGCVASHRYHILRGRSGKTLTEYLLALFSTTHGTFLLNEHSRGAAGRNRPLNIDSLMKEYIPVPDMAIQERVAEAVHSKNSAFRESSVAIDLLQERRTALISATVTGKIDVRGFVGKEAL